MPEDAVKVTNGRSVAGGGETPVMAGNPVMVTKGNSVADGKTSDTGKPEPDTAKKTRFYTYMLRCADGSLYTGWTVDPEHRLKAHNRGRGSRYTRSRLPVELVWYEELPSKKEAMSREWHIKRLNRKEKEKLIGKHTS